MRFLRLRSNEDKHYRKIRRAIVIDPQMLTGHAKNAKPLKFHENQFWTLLQAIENFVHNRVNGRIFVTRRSGALLFFRQCPCQEARRLGATGNYENEPRSTKAKPVDGRGNEQRRYPLPHSSALRMQSRQFHFGGCCESAKAAQFVGRGVSSGRPRSHSSLRQNEQKFSLL